MGEMLWDLAVWVAVRASSPLPVFALLPPLHHFPTSSVFHAYLPHPLKKGSGSVTPGEKKKSLFVLACFGAFWRQFLSFCSLIATLASKKTKYASLVKWWRPTDHHRASSSHHSQGQQNTDSDGLTVTLIVFHPTSQTHTTPPQAALPNWARGSGSINQHNFYLVLCSDSNSFLKIRIHFVQC
jgi:hypothetical protein